MRLIEEEKRDGAGKRRARTRASAKSCGTEHIEYKTSGTRWYRVARGISESVMPLALQSAGCLCFRRSTTASDQVDYLSLSPPDIVSVLDYRAQW